MQQHEIHQFLLQYFKSNACEIVENTPSYMIVQLTIDLDKALMNRPFYWHYLEKTGGIPNPNRLTLITDPTSVPEDVKGEVIHFGSPRLHQIFQSAKNLGSYIRLYENPGSKSSTQTPLHPWLNANIKVSFQCDRKKELLFSLGVNLISGQIMEGFHEKVVKLPLTPKIPDLSFTLSPLIMPKSGLSRLDRYVRLQLEDEDHKWAENAILRWDSDLELLEHFYADMEDKGETYLTEKDALKEQYAPTIQISVINGGMFYLSNERISLTS
ncbi:YqhG family protein [Peribacillus alkalitolerans]|uniref:YqhG family protein n=1 Tax=Peribacillus alkalitolerans TaxID=1550385 RepID=UPI0013D4A326|nr:YqhG family protein [Peribacillus alkalitolerans]